MRYDGSEWEVVAISDLNAECALRVRNFDSPGIAMSDCCQKPARYGVLFPNGAIYWRCSEHWDVVRIHPEKVTGIGMSEIWRRIKT